TEEAARLIRRTGATVTDVLPSGSWAEAGATLLVAEGGAGALFAAWKVAQTLVEAASGMATGARIMVDAARAVRPNVVVACTRKAFPGTRAIAVKAILSGGAVSHRLGLSESVLLFPEHRAFLDGESLAVTLAKLRAGCPEKKLVVEVTSAPAAEEAALAGADVVQLEKFPPALVADVAQRLAILAPTVKLAAAGGVTAANAAAYAASGAHVLVTSAPYLAPPMDVAVTISPING
ncbi:MAG: ModD protein, partial [Magnetospirillum sp.]|nr:ModD protein [Magnetospirillum sp.]